MSIFEIMAAPFAECLVLVAIHTYLGIHVLKRRVIFVDLALAQTAALGTTMGFVFGIMPDSFSSLLFSIVFASVGAAIFALTRMENDIVPQEAIIGLFYAICAALAILVVQKTSGAEHVDDILVGSILWAKWEDVGIAAIAYTAVGLVHYLFRKPFLLISESPKKAYEMGLNVKFWDFIFYLTFGFVISFSVRVAGVLLVFVFLVAPAIMAFLLTSKMKYQLLIGWATGTVVTILGLTISYYGDLPGGPAVIAFYGVVLAVEGVIYYLVKSPLKTVAIRNVTIGCIGAFCLGGCIYGLGNLLAPAVHSTATDLAVVETQIRTDEAQIDVRKEKETKKNRAQLDEWLKNYVSEDLIKAYAHCGDALEKSDFIGQLPEKSKSQLALAIAFLEEPDVPKFFKTQVFEIVQTYTDEELGYNPESANNNTAISGMKNMLKAKNW
ncbi:MAG: metal ABC transporter permease [Deltaproteobacteria bacterium]|nr:metal ABC transporter permease [Deltaproteobacteria bacterium]